jgi:hypothetical protein
MRFSALTATDDADHCRSGLLGILSGAHSSRGFIRKQILHGDLLAASSPGVRNICGELSRRFAT